jgi:murein L,D-transpeptidase YcbB/YkuD
MDAPKIAPTTTAITPPTPQPSVLSPFAQRLRDTIRLGVHPRLRHQRYSEFLFDLEQVYKNSGYQLLWTQEGKPTPQARRVVAGLADAQASGLHAGDYDSAPRFADWIDSLDRQSSMVEGELISFDTALSLALMRYTRDLHQGRLDPRAMNFRLTPHDAAHNYAEWVPRLAKEGNPRKLMATLESGLPLYQRLQVALAKYQVLAEDASLTIPALKQKIQPGDRWSGMAALRRLLYALGDLPRTAMEPTDADVYDSALVSAIKQFQERHGLQADGVIGQGTHSALAVPIAYRVKQIEFSLERLRWLPHPLPHPLILINIPSFQLYAYGPGSQFEAPDLRMGVIVGQTDQKWSTPVFHADMGSVVFRPYWNVPRSIAKEELIPKIRGRSGYLKANNMEIVGGSDQTYAPTGDVLKRVAVGGLQLRQKPGPKNPLGRVKFMFPNDHSVYLHDTPARQLFNKARRDLSHGCIRVEDPVGLADFVLNDTGEWPKDRILGSMNGTKTATVRLKTPIPVYIFYLTAWVDGDDTLYFYDDLYGFDSAMERALTSSSR